MALEGSAAPASRCVRLRATTAAPARARAEATRWAAETGLDDALSLDLRMLVTEVVTNAVRHSGLAPDDELELSLERRGDRVRADIHDGGAGFDDFLPIPAADARSGRGLYLVHRLAAAWGRDEGPPFGVWFELERRSAGV